MIIYSSFYYMTFLAILLLIDLLFLYISLRSKHVVSLFTAVQLQFLCVMLYECSREWQVIHQGAAFPINMMRVHVLNFEYFVYGFFVCKVIDYVEKHWRKALTRPH